MPMQLNVGFSRKVGEPNYSSRGASVSFEVELEANLVQAPEQLREKIRYWFALAEEAVSEQLSSTTPPVVSANAANGNGNQRHTNGRSATASQVRAIFAIAGHNRVALHTKLRDAYHVERPEDLSLTEASQLIDELKAQPNGAGGAR